MAATCSEFQLNDLDTSATSILSSMSGDGLTIFTVEGNYVAPQFSYKINWRKSINGGQTFPSSGVAVDIGDGASLGWDPLNGSLAAQALVCNSTGSQQTVFFYYYVPPVPSAGQTLYARTSTDGGTTWGSIATVSDLVLTITYVSAHMATSGVNDGAIVDVIWSQQATSSADPTHTFIARSIDNATSFVKDEVDPKLPDAASQFPHITGSTDGSIGWAAIAYYGQVLAFTRVGNNSYNVSPASFTSTQTTANFPRISCSGDAQTVAVTYFDGVVSTSGGQRNAPLWCATSDNNGGAWTETAMSTASILTFVTARVLTPNIVTDGGHAVAVSGNSLSSGNSNIIYAVWICPDSTGGARQIRRRRRFLGTWDATSAVVGSTLNPNPSFPLQKVDVVSSYNGAVASAVWIDNVPADNDRPIRYIHTYDGGVTWSSAISLNTVADGNRNVDHPLHSSILGSVTSVFWGDNTATTANPNLDTFDSSTWTRRCNVASSNNVTVVRDFVPDQNTWATSGQHVTYTFTLPAFTTGDLLLSTFLDQNIMESATPSGPADDFTVALSSITFPSGIHLGTATSGTGDQLLANLRFQTASGSLVWSTSEIAAQIVLDLTFSTKPGSGTTDFFAGLPAWNNGSQWSTQASPFKTYIGSTPGFSSSTQNLLLSDALCVAEGSRVRLANGQNLPIEELRPGDLILGENDEAVPVVKLIKLAMPLTNFFQLENEDTQERLLICRGHPILIDGREVLPQKIGKEVILSKPKSIYTFITPSRQFVQIEGFLVGTWSQLSWDNFLSNDPRGAQLRYSEM